MRHSLTVRALGAFLAGLLSGSGLALLLFWPGAERGPVAASLLGGGVALLATVMLAGRRQAAARSGTDERHGSAGRPRLGGVDDVAAVVAALEALRRGYVAQGDGS